MRDGLVREDGLLRGINSVKNCNPSSNRVQAALDNAGAWALPDGAFAGIRPTNLLDRHTDG
jgi:hypothetical protein